jgi:hypothetical protein
MTYKKENVDLAIELHSRSSPPRALARKPAYRGRLVGSTRPVACACSLAWHYERASWIRLHLLTAFQLGFQGLIEG